MRRPAEPASDRELATAFALSAPLALAITAAVEALSAPGGSAGSLPQLFARAVLGCNLLLWPLYSFQLLVAVLFAVGRRLETHPARLRNSVGAVAGGAVVAEIYVGLASYEPFAGYPPFVALFAALWVVVSLAIAYSPRISTAPAPASTRPLALLAGAVLLAGAAGAAALNRALYPGHYPTLHLAALEVAHLLLQLGLAFALLGLPPITRGALLKVVTVAALALLLSPLAISGTAGWKESAATYGRHTTTGHALALRESGDLGSATGASAMDEAEALAAFAELSGLPELPAGFRADRLSVLLISWEATRFDQTSLADPALDTTPNLLGYAEETGAFSFTRAYSPSSITLQSAAAVHSMTWPSATHLDVGRKSWDGTLRPGARTLAEIYSRSGHGSFWIGHDRNACFKDVIHGYDQGFDEVELFLERKSDRTRSPEYGNPASRERPVDELIADAVIAELDRRAAGETPFFGWVFLVSPHAEYLAHDPTRPRRSDLDRYRQELRYADQQTGRILDHLRRTGLDRSTVVVIVGDHGEEFGERGGQFHGSTLYDEQVRVPLLVRLPGVPGRRIEAPISPLYVFPWLLLTGEATLRSPAVDRLRREIAPAMRALDGAVPIELLSRDKAKTALVRGWLKGIRDDLSGAIEIYDLKRDPGERRDLAATHPAERARFEDLFSRFQGLRRGFGRYNLE